MSKFLEFDKHKSEIPPISGSLKENNSQKKEYLISKNKNKLTPEKVLITKLPILIWNDINGEIVDFKVEEESTHVYQLMYDNYE